MTIGYAIALVVGFGRVGGLINAFLTEQGFMLPSIDRLPDGHKIWRPGFAGNVLVGGIVAIVLAGLYSPLGAVEINAPAAANLHLTIASLAGALPSGVGGARLLTRELDKRYSDLCKENQASTAERLIDEVEKLTAKGDESVTPDAGR
jgi:hypothetical protein